MISNLPYLYRNTLRVTRAATLSSTDGSAAEGSKYLGKRGKDFDFSHLQNPVDFVECSAKGNGNSDGELNMVVEWIENLVWKEFWDKLFVLLEEKWLRRSANDMQVFVYSLLSIWSCGWEQHLVTWSIEEVAALSFKGTGWHCGRQI